MTQLCLRGTGGHCRKQAGPPAALPTEALSHRVDGRKASPLEIASSTVQGIPRAFLLRAQQLKWALRGDRRRKMGCLLQGACRQRCSLLKKGREARRKRSHIGCAAKISFHLPCLQNCHLQTPAIFRKMMASMNEGIGTSVDVFLPVKREKV